MMKYRNIIFLISLTVFIFLMNGCFTENKTNNKKLRSKIAFDYEKFKSEKEKWKLLNVKNYSYEYHSLGFNSYSYKIKVENGMYKETLDSKSDVFKKSIDDIYKEIEEFYLCEKSKSEQIENYLTGISIEYDTDNQFLKEVNYLYKFPENWAVDGNFMFRIENFKPE